MVEYYRSKGTHTVKDSCQDNNDFEKSLNLLQDIIDEYPPTEESKVQQREKVIVLFPFGGRMDHTLSSMHILSKR